ncbi:MAG: BlaI/MecI/CopY family transcriptional regulator [Bacillota bacterium]|nr:BlaI/MecI/CopY family transcriptional regulator [Bacillota bacterium]
MVNVPQISDTEWQVMKVIWAKNSPVTANQVIEALEGSCNWKPKTIKTLLGRLVKKKALSFNKESREYVYYSLISEKECVRAENKSFLSKVYGGAFNIMFASFLEEEKLTLEEISELKKILEDKSSEKTD